MPQVAINPQTEALLTGREDLRSIVQQVRRRIGNRMELVAKAALLEEPEWKTALLSDLGPELEGLDMAGLVCRVAVYRDRWGLHDSLLPLGTAPAEWEWEQNSQRQQLLEAVQAASHARPEQPVLADYTEMSAQQTLTSAGWQL